MLGRFAVRRPAYSEVLKVAQTRVFCPPHSAGALVQTRDFARKSVWKPGTTKVETEMSPRDRDILSRITVVEEVAESARVVEHLIRQGRPVAVDVEGNTLGVTGLVQVKDAEGNYTYENKDSTALIILFHVMFIVVGSFFVINLFVGVVIDNFNALKEGADGGKVFMTEEQQDLIVCI